MAVELTMALLQFLNNNPSEEYLFRALKSLARFCQISGQEVTQLIQMIGPDPKKFKGKSCYGEKKKFFPVANDNPVNLGKKSRSR